jgi:hypothetical protein
VPATTPSGNRDRYRNEHREDRELDRCRVTFEDQTDDRTVIPKRQTHVAVQQRAPVVGVTIVRAVPDEMPFAVVVTWEREEEGRTIESVFLAELRELFGRSLLAKNATAGSPGTSSMSSVTSETTVQTTNRRMSTRRRPPRMLCRSLVFNRRRFYQK